MDASEIQYVFAVVEARPDIIPVQVSRRGDSLSFASTRAGEPLKRARLARLGHRRWSLQRPLKRRGTWRDPWFVGTLEEAMTELMAELARFGPGQEFVRSTHSAPGALSRLRPQP